MMDEIEAYNRLIEDYRRKFREVKAADEERAARGWIEYLNKERNDIHKELRRVGAKIGKSSQDITLDILESEKNLSEHRLPEFKILSTSKAMDKITRITMVDSDGTRQEIKKDDNKYPDEISAFIPFGQQESWHLFDDEVYSSRQPDEKERRRRIARVVSLMKGRARAIEIYSSEKFHRGTTLFGVACSSDNVEPLLAVMREHRSEVSIDKKFFDSQRIDEDTRDMVQEDLNYILSRESNEHESRSYLIQRLGNHLMNFMGIEGKVREEIKQLVADAQDKAICIEKAIESERDGEAAVKDLDTTEQLYPKETTMPKTEPFGRR